MSEHYFSAEPRSAARAVEFTATVWGHDLRMSSMTGLFSHACVDPGTRVLVGHERPWRTSRTVLDLGCGTGVLATALGLELPAANVWAVDVNQRARDVTAANARAHGLAHRLHVLDPDGVSDGVLFDEIWSNPPIRIGKDAVHELLLRWLAHLRPGGRAMLVIGRNLGADSYQRWLGEQGWSCVRRASAKGFRVLQVMAVDRGRPS